jgi:hypothetical protein
VFLFKQSDISTQTYYLNMVMCLTTVIIGLVVMFAGAGGGVRIGGVYGMTIGGGAGAVITILGLFGTGC